MMSTRRSPSSQRPVRTLVVVPGKLDVFARAPQSRLKSVVLPVFGLPSSAMRPAAAAATAGGRSAVGAVAGILDHVDVPGYDARQPDLRRPHLDDERLAALADA